MERPASPAIRAHHLCVPTVFYPSHWPPRQEAVFGQFPPNAWRRLRGPAIGCRVGWPAPSRCIGVSRARPHPRTPPLKRL
eukprot:11109483-Lingulodinium_polyedra.AAC.1